MNLKIRAIALTAVLASLIGPSVAHAENMVTDHDHLNGYARMTYHHISLNEGQEAEVAVQGAGNTVLRVSVYDYKNNLIGNTTCRVDTCSVRWVANRDAAFFVTVKNLGAYSTSYGFALER